MAKEQEPNTQQQKVAVPEASAPVAQQPQARPCPQDCRLCGINQQIFCTTKMLFDLSRRQQILEMAVAEMAKTLADIQAQMQEKDDTAGLSIPFSE